jgi:hypothetical protein
MKAKVLLASALVIGLIGCANTKPKKENDFNACIRDGAKAPKWVCAPTQIEGGITAVGIAMPNAANDEQFQLDEAMAAARDALARRISIKVKNMFKQFKATTGTGANQTYEKATEEVSRQVAYQVLNGSRLLNSWQSPSGKLYVLVGIPKETAVKSVKKAIKTSLKNNEALYQKFLAKKAQEELDKEIEKEFGGN